ncbi:hypothetical protein C8A03DRAFT_30255 [Achaetomium macrosporum]|uniref:Protein YAE1 n=1 Tax=Achaetomium macrosporum TaxID=79813 RepID=A0AAN7HFF5_9PEZI|nr:hypothetical protein C8A03DRAFT_30255 [Achaetomium macrosporum]
MSSHTPATDYHEEDPYRHQNENDTLSDIWEDAEILATMTTSSHHYQPQPHQVSDIPRLSQVHSTAGYRDGITLAKSRTAQQGFDEGYGLGATIGQRAGQLLGVLEGLAAAVGLHSLSLSSHQQSRQGQGREEARRIEGLLADARRELNVRGVFGSQFWAEDGNWRYEVGTGATAEVPVFADVAEAHPLLRKWSGIVRAEAARYGVDWEILKDEVGEARREEEDEDEQQEREGRTRRDGNSRTVVRERETTFAW